MTNMQNNATFGAYLELTKKQQEYIRLKNETDLAEGEIAVEIDVNRSTISRWKHNDKFREGFKGYQAEHLSKQVPKALQTMINLLDAKSELVRYQASKDILDRTGYTPVERQQIETTATVQFNDDID
ncbi:MULTISPECIES: phBC6A51 family helix-turn-helix protein [Staphylococcus]|uniref:phBC6A51 family helix-turn-helix protein n=1 Tax=Staphylococcus TaxID=1279 RepID=UPI000207C654|nr:MULTISPECIES: phBC6A51 family helix-turn-helix protein [Staphylococcus]EAE5914399.1 DNA-binding protein [Listeria monocytogenes]MDU4964881.1 phBC6A51 family helix-turn-helix protein [Staphylococcus warneri]QQV93149.1 terminase small subunit [Staphylococcus virus vB_SepS_27]QQV93215.1 terminase small subunit [Staphylococcus virus vB_SepS_48]QQV93416.1 terminase small subunit [Staphylococcus virus vB_SepS_E72]WEU70001.1 terminase small subunit [Staphylococcus phage vB_SepS_BE20]HEF4447412.1